MVGPSVPLQQVPLAPANAGSWRRSMSLETASGSDLWHLEPQTSDSQLLASPVHFL